MSHISTKLIKSVKILTLIKIRPLQTISQRYLKWIPFWWKVQVACILKIWQMKVVMTGLQWKEPTRRLSQLTEACSNRLTSKLPKIDIIPKTTQLLKIKKNTMCFRSEIIWIRLHIRWSFLRNMPLIRSTSGFIKPSLPLISGLTSNQKWIYWLLKLKRDMRLSFMAATRVKTSLEFHMGLGSLNLIYLICGAQIRP